MVHRVGLPLPAAVAMASLVPARKVGLAARKGSLAPGKDADITVLDPDLRCAFTLVGGRLVYER
ncbi:amidohydrolase family protein [Calditerricola satsumensis]|uniref:Amidohydrolase-related domain-containing protein n=2 Tax=Calditerricola satsumensis TaxID=373054 RepID=A0A8J3FAH1_9BACI|nr:amidohydrolase family protein [Calditerricola satsumensis]GGK00917.1 hypothetical protein GCM10007043_13720 [Calditerricola satsumensis]